MKLECECNMDILYLIMGIYLSKYESYNVSPSPRQWDASLDCLCIAKKRHQRGDLPERVLSESLTHLARIFVGPLREAELESHLSHGSEQSNQVDNI